MADPKLFPSRVKQRKECLHTLMAKQPCKLQSTFETGLKYMVYYKPRELLLVPRFASIRLHPRMENMRLSLAYMFCNNILSAGKRLIKYTPSAVLRLPISEWKHCINLAVPLQDVTLGKL